MASDGPPARGAKLGRSAVKAVLWSAASVGGNRLVVFGSTLVLARLLAPRAFGTVAAGMTLINFLEVAFDLGLSEAIIYEQEATLSDRLHTAFTANVAASGALALVGVAGAPLLAGFFGVPGQVWVFRALPAYLVIRGVAQVHDAILRRGLRFRDRTLVSLAGSFVRAGLSIGLAAAGFDVWAIVWGFLGGELTLTVATWLIVPYRPRLRWDPEVARPMLRFGGSIVALDVLGELALNSDYLVVGGMLGATQLGFYTMAFRLPELLISSAFWVLQGVVFPVYAKARGEGPTVFKAAMLRLLRLLTMYGLPVGVGLALVSRDAMLVMFSPKWSPAAPAMALISLALGLASVGYASGDIFPAVGRPGQLVGINLVETSLRVGGFVIAAPYGIAAVAAVHLGINFLWVFVRLGVANRLVGTSTSDVLAALRPTLATTVGLVALALPVRLLAPSGTEALLATIAAGVVGGAAGLAIAGRDAVDDLRELAHHAVAR